MKLLVTLAVLATTAWSYQPQTRIADWSRSFDHNGWSECPRNYYISGMYRSGRQGRNGLNHIEQVQCTQATSPVNQVCTIGNWWSSFDRRGWSTCQNGHFVRGFMRTGPHPVHPDALRELEEARCCRPNTGVVRFGHCINHNVWRSWDNAGWFRCNKGYYLVGIWRNNAGCENLGCMEEFRCCQMIAVNPCTRGNGGCQHKCRNNGGTAVCSCNNGYKLVGKACVDKNECTDGSHKCAHKCINTAGSYKCQCRRGFALGKDGKSCNDIDECKTGAAKCSQTCTNKAGSFKCQCRKGYKLGKDGRTCIDINECKAKKGGCAQLCINTVGSFRCRCRRGFKLGADSKSCVAIDPCKTNNGGCAHICSNKNGIAVCSCKRGFQMKALVKSCKPQKVPYTVNAKFDCWSGCGKKGGVCTKVCGKGGYCCRKNFKGCPREMTAIASTLHHTCMKYRTDTKPCAQLGPKTCVDKNECRDGSHKCAQKCVNTIGSFKCQCRRGFTLGKDGKSCNDIDECKTGAAKCSQTCTNTAGSFKCQCRKGFKLGKDGRTCVDINECKAKKGGCAQLCINTVGSFKCRCRRGYKLGADARTCVAINPCLRNNGGCAHICSAKNGVAVCSCKAGFKLADNSKGCVPMDPCLKMNGGCDHKCTNKNGVAFCEPLNEPINPCLLKNGGCAHLCTLRNGAAVCSCRKGYHLLPNRKSCTPFEVVNEGGVTYLNVNKRRCESVTKRECTKIAKSHGIPLREIINPNFNRFPPGCYHKTTSNVVYYNDKPSTKECTTKRVCICKPNLYPELRAVV